MKLIPYFPRPPLSRFVELIWMLKGRPHYSREKVLPNGAIELIINLGSYHKVIDRNDSRRFEVFRNCWIAGMQEEYIIIGAFDESDLIGIRFQQGGAYPFLSLPMVELTNRVVESDQILGAFVAQLREQLMETNSAADRLLIIETMLMKRIGQKEPDPLAEYVSQKLRERPDRSIAELSRSAGVSDKHLIAIFKKNVGVTPKFLARIFRFQKVLGLVKDLDRVNWTEIAYHCNYFDQAHLIKDFYALSGSKPSEYLKNRDEDENHIIIR
jgi:AraC-like DNA-binding protein